MCGICLSCALSAVKAPSVTVQSSSVTSTTIPLSWTSAGSVVDSYEVMWTAGPRDCPGVSGGSATVDGDTTAYTIEGLEEYITYTITVTATNAVGSAVGDQATQRTSEAGKSIFQVYEQSICVVCFSCSLQLLQVLPLQLVLLVHPPPLMSSGGKWTASTAMET